MGARTLEWSLERLKALESVAMASIVESDGSVPAKVGARMAISSSGLAHGTVGGAGLEMKVEARLRGMLEGGYGGIETFVLSKENEDASTTNLNSLCGGRVVVAFEKLEPRPHLLLMGGGHVAQAISEACGLLGWSYSVFDERKEFVSEGKFPDAEELIFLKAEEFLKSENLASLGRFSDILLLGHDWSIDEQLLVGILTMEGEKMPRIGCIGSKTKWRAFVKSAKSAGAPTQKIDDVRCPIGVPIDAVTVEEIAFSVCSEIIHIMRSDL
ncbi:MAG TPA: hypothetical protein D7H73_03305 [Candidatus Poseidoniales archaeon]|nr:MAG TPA: hypothetical protein D7H73_03305 [Candidatus Poseidoniales archaeon]